MNKTQQVHTGSAVVNGRDLNVGDRVIHPHTGRIVQLMDELHPEGDYLRRFFVRGVRGRWDALVVGETAPVVLA